MDTTKDGAMIQDSTVFSKLIRDYKAYKSTFVKNVKFNSTSANLGEQNKKTYYAINTYPSLCAVSAAVFGALHLWCYVYAISRRLATAVTHLLYLFSF